MGTIKLSENYTLEDFTVTSLSQYQELNRIVDETIFQNLKNLAGLVEFVRQLLDVPRVTVNSAYRCPELNKAIGSTILSQHMRGEAADIVPFGITVEEGFRKLRKAVESGGMNVGQLIHETAERSYGNTSWIHISLGWPWREANKCNQILRMEHGKYELFWRPEQKVT